MLRLWTPLLKARGPRRSPALPIASAGPVWSSAELVKNNWNVSQKREVSSEKSSTCLINCLSIECPSSFCSYFSIRESERKRSDREDECVFGLCSQTLWVSDGEIIKDTASFNTNSHQHKYIWFISTTWNRRKDITTKLSENTCTHCLHLSHALSHR